MSEALRPPRFARALLRRSLPANMREHVAADLDELYERRARRDGLRRARGWYRWQALSFALRFSWERLREHMDRGTGKGGWTMGTSISVLDFKLGVRMLLKHPGLTLVSGVAMAFAIAVGSGTFEFAKDALYPALPVPDGDRIVRIRYVDRSSTQTQPVPLEDYRRLREELGSFEALAAARIVQRNLDPAGGGGPITGAAVSAMAFDLAAAVPLLGRLLATADEVAGAPPVVVLGHDLWKGRFGGESDVAGRVVRLGDQAVTVVGVLPEDFAFPAPLDFFVPLRAEATDTSVPDRTVDVFGRLAPGVTLADAQAEVAGLEPPTDETGGASSGLERQVAPFAEPVISTGALQPGGVLALIALFLVGLVLVACANVALLLYARAATREGEIVVRSALGATRARIVGQLFTEALVLAALGTLGGLAGAAWGLRWVMGVMEAQVGGALPPWIGSTLSPTTVAWAGILGLTCASLLGVLPALKATGPDVQARLGRVAGRGSGIRIGGVWSGIIVAQVALTALFLPIVFWVAGDVAAIRNADLGVPGAGADYLAVELQLDGEPGRFRQVRDELLRRLEAEPAVRAAALGSQLPGGWHPRRDVELDDDGGPPEGVRPYPPQAAWVQPDFFGVLGARFVAGRPFSEGQREVVVNESFVRVFLGGRSAVGRRFRHVDEARDEGPGPSYEIVGVIEDMALTVDPDLPHNAGVYHPLGSRPGPVHLAVRLPDGPVAFTARLREIAASVDPGLRIDRPMPLDEITRDTLLTYDTWLRVIVIAGAIALLLVNAGIYSVMSVQVSRRVREIGVRRALGAEAQGIVASIFARVLRQVLAGIVLGVGLLVLLVVASSGGTARPTMSSVAFLFAHMIFMTLVCMASCAVPMRRALRVEPTEALRADG